MKDEISLLAVAYDTKNRQMPAPKLYWSSTDPSIASVDPNGRVTGHALGAVQIRAITAEGLEGSVGIDVRAAQLRISLRTGPATMMVGETATLRAELLDLSGEPITSGGLIQWSAGDSTVVSLRPVAGSWDAELTALSAGLVTISARAPQETQRYVLAVVSTRTPANPPLQVSDFALLEFQNLSDFYAFGPALRVTIKEGTSVEILRVVVMVPAVHTKAFPHLCSGERLSSGNHEILGPLNYPWDVYESFTLFSPVQVEGVALLTYRADDGRTYGVEARGQVVITPNPFSYGRGFPWHSCTE